ncbi:hypothetical protein [Citromicrobium bathyomarinum]|uniref:hypothetical protein n=1 Tax=Citromicrobium bathyomarinum TaxID=72174 RepID=UPI00315AC5D4
MNDMFGTWTNRFIVGGFSLLSAVLTYAWAIHSQQESPEQALLVIPIGAAAATVIALVGFVVNCLCRIPYEEWAIELSARRRLEAQLDAPIDWVPLDDAIRYLANYPVPKAKLHFDHNLPIRISNALRDALLCGDLQARGRRFDTLRGGIKNPPLHGLKPIPPEDWDGIHIESYFVLNGRLQQSAAGRHASTVNTADNQGYHAIIVRRDQLQALWPEAGAMLE